MANATETFASFTLAPGKKRAKCKQYKINGDTQKILLKGANPHGGRDAENGGGVIVSADAQNYKTECRGMGMRQEAGGVKEQGGPHALSRVVKQRNVSGRFERSSWGPALVGAV